MRVDFPRKLFDRIVMALVCLLISLFALGFLEGEAILWKTGSLWEAAVKLLVEEITAAFVIFFALAFVWVVFSPKWVEKLLDRYVPTLIIGGAVLGLAGIGILVGIEIWRAAG